MSIKVGYKIKYKAFYSSIFPSGFTFLVQHFILRISERIYISLVTNLKYKRNKNISDRNMVRGSRHEKKEIPLFSYSLSWSL